MNYSIAIHKSASIQKSYKNFHIGLLDGQPVVLRVPSFDCEWYWGFGYLGNRNCHFHLDSLHTFCATSHNKNMYDQLIEVFGDSLTIPHKALWTFCEIVKTIYTLRNTAELFHRGGSHYTTNPDKDTLKVPEIAEKINNELIPMQIHTLWDFLDKYRDK